MSNTPVPPRGGKKRPSGGGGRPSQPQRRPSARSADIARRKRNRNLGIGSVAVVVVVIVVLVVVKVAGGGSSSSAAETNTGTVTPAVALAKLQSIPYATLAAASTKSLNPPISAKDPALPSTNGKPVMLYIGAEFCPYCAVERYALYVALSKFGTFSPQPGQIHSAASDGDIPTLTFYGTTYTSKYLDFQPIENETRNRTLLEPTTAAETAIWKHYNGQNYPFIDLNGKTIFTGTQYAYYPDWIGPTFDSIISQIGDNTTTIGNDVDAGAKVLIQSICKSLTGGQPADVCSAVGG